MNKTERHNYIKAFIEKNSAGRLEANKEGIEEEKNLALQNQKDDSILDEEQKDSFITPALAAALRPSREEGKEENLLLNKSELAHLSHELKRPVSFLKLKGVAGVQSSEETPFDKLNLKELTEFAEAHG